MSLGAERRSFVPFFRSLDSRRVWSLVLWAVTIWVVVFWRLGYTSLLDPDEAHYAELTREMLRSGNWFVPLLDGAPYIDKPVLFHWLQGASVEIFGESEFAMRLPSTLAALLLFWMTRQLGIRLLDKRTGGRGAMMFATIPATFMLASIGVFDMIFAAFLFGSVACLLMAAAEQRRSLEYTGWALLTLAVMTKGPVALLLVGGFFLSATFIDAEARTLVRRLEWPAGLAFAFFAASPWFVWMWGRFGDDFVSRYLIAGNLWYMTDPLAFSTRTSSYTFYLRTFTGAFFPWSLIAIGAAADALLRVRRGWRPPVGEKLLWLWIGVVLVFFTVAGFKLDTYIFPAAPACCLLAAAAWQRASEDRAWRWTRAAAVVMAIVLITGGAVLSLAMFQINLGVDLGAIALPVVMMIGGAGLLWELWDRQWRVPVTITIPVVTLVAVYGFVVLFGFPVLERSRPTAPLGRWIHRHSKPDTPVATFGLNDWRASIRYYTDRNVSELRDTQAIGTFFKESPKGYVLMLRDQYDRLRAEGLDIKTVQRRPMISGRSGKYLRHQIWQDLVVVTHQSTLFADGEP